MLWRWYPILPGECCWLQSCSHPSAPVLLVVFPKLGHLFSERFVVVIRKVSSSKKTYSTTGYCLLFSQWGKWEGLGGRLLLIRESGSVAHTECPRLKLSLNSKPGVTQAWTRCKVFYVKIVLTSTCRWTGQWQQCTRAVSLFGQGNEVAVRARKVEHSCVPAFLHPSTAVLWAGSWDAEALLGKEILACRSKVQMHIYVWNLLKILFWRFLQSNSST